MMVFNAAEFFRWSCEVYLTAHQEAITNSVYPPLTNNLKNPVNSQIQYPICNSRPSLELLTAPLYRYDMKRLSLTN
jgi:hypothetical protein